MNVALWPPPYTYGFVTIWLAALIAATTWGGAPIGGIARPLTILAFGAGWNAGSEGETPPVLVVEVSANAAPGSRPAQANANTASKSGVSARFGKFSFVRLPS